MNEIEQFEAALRGEFNMNIDQFGTYRSPSTESAWRGWQARGAQTAEPVAYRFTENRGNGKTEYSFYGAEQAKVAYLDNCLEVTPLYL